LIRTVYPKISIFNKNIPYNDISNVIDAEMVQRIKASIINEVLDIVFVSQGQHININEENLKLFTDQALRGQMLTTQNIVW